MNLLQLEIEIEKQGIKLFDFDFSGTKFKGLYTNNTIAIDKNISSIAEQKCILAEELGHHYTSYGDILDQSNVMNLKQEKKARNWGYDNLCGILDLIKAYEYGCKNIFEIAEFLDLTENFVEESIEHLKEKHGTHFEIDDYIVYFTPTLGVMRKKFTH